MPSFAAARPGWLLLALATSFSAPVLATSEQEELSRARAKFQQATELEQAGNYAGALQKLREVAQVRMTPQVRFHIATCEEKLGKLATALGGYELALTESESLGPEFQAEVEERASALRARIPKLVIERSDGAEAATIELDGISLGASSIGIEVPVDPGPHAVSAKAPGYKPFSVTVEVPERQIETVKVTLEKLEEEGPARPKSSVVDTAYDSEAPKRSRVIPYVIGGFGVAALINSGVFYALQRSTDKKLYRLCGNDTDCTDDNLDLGDQQEAQDLNDKLGLYTTVTRVSLVVGVVAIGAATVLILTEPKPAKQQAAWFFAPEAPGADLAGLSLKRNF